MAMLDPFKKLVYGDSFSNLTLINSPQKGGGIKNVQSKWQDLFFRLYNNGKQHTCKCYGLTQSGNVN